MYCLICFTSFRHGFGSWQPNLSSFVTCLEPFTLLTLETAYKADSTMSAEIVSLEINWKNVNPIKDY